MNNTYDFVVIGSGISACTFASCLNERFSDSSILLVEQGRRIGGRATTRNSRKNKILEFDHGLPSINFSKNISQEILTLIQPLINSKKLVDISSDILKINEFGEIYNPVSNYKTYRSFPFMINFCQEIINQSNNPKKIHFKFQALTKSIKRINDLWEININNERFIKSNNLILSSSLIAHSRCFQILNINSLPLREAFILGEDEVVDSVLKEVRKQKYLIRKVYIFHCSNIAIVQNFNHQYLQILFSKVIRSDLNFERIIFQSQSDGSMIFVLHCYGVNKFLDMNIIIKHLNSIFENHQIFLDLFLQARLIDKMDWRASQPLDHFLPRELQWSSTSRIGFCGDWVDSGNLSAVESGMNSSIRLAKLLNWE